MLRIFLFITISLAVFCTANTQEQYCKFVSDTFENTFMVSLLDDDDYEVLMPVENTDFFMRPMRSSGSANHFLMKPNGFMVEPKIQRNLMRPEVNQANNFLPRPVRAPRTEYFWMRPMKRTVRY